MTERHKRVFEILRDNKGEDVAGLYNCILWILDKMDLPQKVRLMAYCLREILNGMGLNPFDNLSDYSDRLKKAWNEKLSSVQITPENITTEQKCVLKFLIDCKELVAELEARPTICDQMAKVLEEDDPNKAPAPRIIRHQKAKTLRDIRREATDILHGSKSETITVDAFIRILQQFEGIVLSVLSPATFDDQRILDDLIKKAEAGDN